MPDWLDSIDSVLAETGADPEASVRISQRTGERSDVAKMRTMSNLVQRRQDGMPVNANVAGAVMDMERGQVDLPTLEMAQKAQFQQQAVDEAKRTGQTGAQIPVIGTTLDSLKYQGLGILGGAARAAEDAGLAARNEDAQQIGDLRQQVAAGQESAPIGRNVGGAVPFMAPGAAFLAPLTMAAGAYSDARDAGAEGGAAALDAVARAAITAATMRVAPFTNRTGAPTGSLPAAVGRQAALGALDALPQTLAMSGGSALASKGIAAATGDKVLGQRADEEMAALANPDMLPELLIANTVGGAIGAPGMRRDGIRALDKQAQDTAQRAQMQLDLRPREAQAPAGRVEDLARDLQVPSEREAAQMQQAGQAEDAPVVYDPTAARAAPDAGADFTGQQLPPGREEIAGRGAEIAQKERILAEQDRQRRVAEIDRQAQADAEAKQRTAAMDAEDARVAVAAEDRLRQLDPNSTDPAVQAEIDTLRAHVDRARSRAAEEIPAPADEASVDPGLAPAGPVTLEGEIGRIRAGIKGGTMTREQGAQALARAKARIAEQDGKGLAPTPAKQAEMAPRAPAAPVMDPGTGRPLSEIQKDSGVLPETAKAEPVTDGDIPVTDKSQEDTAIPPDAPVGTSEGIGIPQADRISPERQRALGDIKDKFVAAVRGKIGARVDGDRVVIDVPGEKKAEIHLVGNPAHAVAVYSHPSNAAAVVASLAAAGRTIGSANSPRAKAFTNDAAGRRLWNELPASKKKEFIEGLHANGELPAFIVTNPHADGTPLNLSAIIHVLNPKISEGKLAHEYIAHAAMVGQMPDGMVTRLASALVKDKHIQTTDPQAANYIDPNLLGNVKALRNDGTLQEVFGTLYDQFHTKQREGEAPAAGKDAQIQAGIDRLRFGQKKPGALAPFFAWIRQKFGNLFKAFKTAEKPMSDLDAAMRDVYKGDFLENTFDMGNAEPRTSRMAELQLADQKAYEAKATREKGVRSREAERTMKTARNADLAEPAKSTYDRVAEIARQIETLTKEAPGADPSRRMEIRDHLAGLRAEKARQLAELKAQEVGQKADDDKELQGLSDDGKPLPGEKFAVERESPEERKSDYANPGVSREGRKLGEAINDAYETPEDRMVASEAQSILQGFRHKHGGDIPAAYDAFVSKQIDELTKDVGKVNASRGTVEALRQVSAHFENMMGTGTPTERKIGRDLFSKAMVAIRLSGTEAGRFLAGFRDKIQTPAERASFLRTMLYQPNRMERLKAQQLTDAGKSAEAAKYLTDTARKNYERSVRDFAEQNGVDLEALLRDPSNFEGDLGEQFAIEISNRIAESLNEPSVWGLLKASVQNNHLTATGQAIVNPIGNLMLTGMEIGKKLTNPAEAKVMTKAMASAVPEAFSRAWKAFKAGNSLLERETIGNLRRVGDRNQQSWRDPIQSLAERTVASGENAGAKAKILAAKAVSKATLGLMPRRLGVMGDEFFSTIWYKAMLAANAHADGKAQKLSGEALAKHISKQTENPSPGQREAAGVKAAEMTGRMESDPKGFIALINKIRNQDNALGLGATMVMPFFNTLVQLTKKSLEYSPVGAIYHTATKAGRTESLNETMGRLIVAGSILGAVAFADDETVGGTSAPFKGDKAEYFRQQRADQSGVINIGGYSLDLKRLAPAGIPITQSKDIINLLKNKDSLGETLGKLVRGSIGEQFFPGVENVANLMTTDPGAAGVQTGVNMAAGFVPGKGIQRDLDSAIRGVTGEGKASAKSLPSANITSGPAMFLRDVLRTGSPLAADALLPDKRVSARSLYGKTSSSVPVLTKQATTDWDRWLEKADTKTEQMRRAAKATGNTAALERLKISEPGLRNAGDMSEKQYEAAVKRAGEIFLERLASSGLNPKTTEPTPENLKRVSALYGVAWNMAKREALSR